MLASLQHRGPDDSGSWVDEFVGVALGHQRLAIQDLSPSGHQPMASACGRYLVIFNGEIYNHLDLRVLLAHSNVMSLTTPDLSLPGRKLYAGGYKPNLVWRGHSDTETLLAGIAAWGIEDTLNRCVGMFAFALWDRKTQTLTLARDRFGEKPLYYGWVGQGASRAFAFSSELKH
jgi:asparagine synthase (glutamine-hydrolysing)